MTAAHPAAPPVDATSGLPKSPNFQFLAVHHPLLVRFAALAERYLFDDPSTALFKLRQFAELLARQACAYVGLPATPQEDFVKILGLLRDRKVTTPDILDLFHGLRKVGNAATHEGTGTRSEALHQLRMARELAVWFHRSFREAGFKPGPFLPPPDPALASQELHEELERLRQQVVEKEKQAQAAALHLEQITRTAEEETAARQEAEARAQAAYADLTAALELAEETETKLNAAQAQFQQELTALQAAAAAQPPAALQLVVNQAQQAATLLDLDEQATRHIIDQQLREAGWEADSQEINFRRGTRPQKGRNLAIAEWPTASGSADYVLFVGLSPVAAIEAKRAIEDVAGAIEQAKRYSRDYQAQPEEQSPGGPWGVYRLPFCFATNGRGYLRQIETKSGIWFLDARQETNHSRALAGWYTPAGLWGLLQQDIPGADQKLLAEPPGYLPLRDYQEQAVLAVEAGLRRGLRELLVAMATGTGKTITCIGMVYRLLKAGRFRRVLFLVDRTSLAEQTDDKLRSTRLENLLTFPEIYEVLGLDKPAPDDTTRLHIATVQGLVRRLLYSKDGTPALPVDAYDCIIVDECHRGYALDRDLSEAELTFRDEADYISKYRRVLDHFDAVKIGLTATPALHTVEIFGHPVFTYSYRQAVIEGHLSDHEPPIRIVTKLAEDGITWQRGETIQTYLKQTGEIDPVTAPDDVELQVDEFNRRVITRNFNQVVCAALAEHIDPNGPGKTIVFCVDDTHADLVVGLLKEAFTQKHGLIPDDTVLKITGAADKPLQLIRRFRNERLPNVAVTVDLLTTGIDVHAVTNLVFLRQVRSRILYEQMLGRATRRCPDLYGPGLDKDVFRIFDAVDLYTALEPYCTMKPVVVQPTITFSQLAEELSTATADTLQEIQEQFAAKLQRRQHLLEGERGEEFTTLAGQTPEDFTDQVLSQTPEELRDWLTAHPQVPDFLDKLRTDPRRLLISEHPDELRRIERGYGTAARPEDYLESFRKYLRENVDRIEALKVVTQRPRELTRAQLKELKLALHEAGFTEPMLQTAWREATNQDIAASIIGYIRHIINDQPLLPYRERVRQALAHLLSSRTWTNPQRKWLERIGKQLEVETVVDREALNHGQFQAEGGYDRLNKVFEGKLEQVLGEIIDAVWTVAA